MSGALPPSLLITPDLRRQLQQRFEQAQRLAAAAPPDFRRIHELLADCVQADPGNVLYLDALLANLWRWQPKRSWFEKWLTGWTGRAGAPANRSHTLPAASYLVPSAQFSELCAAPQQLLTRPTDVTLLQQLAAAAAACDFEEVELRYWQLAIDVAPRDGDALRGLARALTRQGRFEQAAVVWENLPSDMESAAALADFDLPALRKLDEQEQSLAEAQAAGGPLLELLARREALQLERAQQRLLVAQRRSQHDPHPKSAALVDRLAAEQARLEIEILHLRCERLPGDWRVRLELARRLKQAGNFSGAIQRLEEAGSIEPAIAAVVIELGENWQHLRQFAKATEYYRQAIATADGEDLKLALFHGGSLAAASGRPDEGRQCFTRLVSLDPSYRDARERLDNLGRN